MADQTAMTSETSRASPPVFPETWVARIFQRLHGASGAKFTAAFSTGQTNDAGEDVGIANAKAVWADRLTAAGLAANPSAVSYALTLACDSPFPPTLGEFVAFCRAAPRPNLPALENGGARPTADTAAAITSAVRSLSTAQTSLESRSAWAVRGLQRIADGEKLPLICETNAAEALANLGATHLAPSAYAAKRTKPWPLAVVR